jgi:Kef-type K+ transport system membrane component KefB
MRSQSWWALSFLAEIGFAMLVFAVGMSVPLRQEGLRESLGKGAATALIVAALELERERRRVVQPHAHSAR